MGRKESRFREIEYILTMTSDQAHECLKAVELLMRLKINQSDEISRAVMPDNYWDKNGKIDSEKFDDFLRRRDEVDLFMKMAFAKIFPTHEDIVRDDEWYTLCNLYQVLRYQIYLAEHPNSTGVDSREPIQFTTEPLPVGSWRIKDDNDTRRD